MAKQNENDINDLLNDPEPPDENDPEFREEMFAIHKSHGAKPEDLKGATPEWREQYAEWLKSQSE